MPLLRHVISIRVQHTKLALLHTLCRVADGAAGFARDHDDEFATVPLGLVALTWVRLFTPLLRSGLPQSPSNVGYERLGFVKEAFRKLTDVSHLDLRVGMVFSGELGAALHQSLKDAAETEWQSHSSGKEDQPSLWAITDPARPDLSLRFWRRANPPTSLDRDAAL